MSILSIFVNSVENVDSVENVNSAENVENVENVNLQPTSPILPVGVFVQFVLGMVELPPE